MTAIINYTINHKPLLMVTAGVTGVLLGKGCEWLRTNPQNGKINNAFGKGFVTGLEKVAGFVAPILDLVGKALIVLGSVRAIRKLGRNPKEVITNPILDVRVVNNSSFQRMHPAPVYRGVLCYEHDGRPLNYAGRANFQN